MMFCVFLCKCELKPLLKGSVLRWQDRGLKQKGQKNYLNAGERLHRVPLVIKHRKLYLNQTKQSIICWLFEYIVPLNKHALQIHVSWLCIHNIDYFNKIVSNTGENVF
jgi:hypothetical protein